MELSLGAAGGGALLAVVHSNVCSPHSRARGLGLNHRAGVLSAQPGATRRDRGPLRLCAPQPGAAHARFRWRGSASLPAVRSVPPTARRRCETLRRNAVTFAFSPANQRGYRSRDLDRRLDTTARSSTGSGPRRARRCGRGRRTRNSRGECGALRARASARLRRRAGPRRSFRRSPRLHRTDRGRGMAPIAASFRSAPASLPACRLGYYPSCLRSCPRARRPPRTTWRGPGSVRTGDSCPKTKKNARRLSRRSASICFVAFPRR